jgi:hypothetical protein
MSKLFDSFRSKWTSLRNYVQDHATALKIFGVLVLVIAGIWIVINVPGYQVRKKVTGAVLSIDEDHARTMRLEDDFRKTITQIVLGVFGLLIIYFTWRRSALMEQGHITDRFTKAVEQLGKTDEGGQPNLEIRMGAIYALERIAEDSPRDHWPIMEILTAYVRLNTKLEKEETYTQGKKPSPEIQAILTVLGRRKTDHGREDRSNLQYLDLMGTCLWGAKLTGANFQGVDLEKADLRGSLLFGARLQGAALMETNLIEADLREANLDKSYFCRKEKLSDAKAPEAQYVSREDIKSAIKWQSAVYSRAFRNKLGIPPTTQ